MKPLISNSTLIIRNFVLCIDDRSRNLKDEMIRLIKKY